MSILTRRSLLTASAATGGLILSGCDRFGNSATGTALLESGEALTYKVQRSLVDRAALAQEFSAAQMSPHFRTNGNTMPAAPHYAALRAQNFAEWRLAVDGLVRTPLSLSRAALQAMPRRTQITAHHCVEGWTAIGKWTGTPLRLLLQQAGLMPQARFIVFHCADDFDGQPYYESIDLVDAFHPQTIMAWAMNDAVLEVGHGAPLRLRVERQLGYKQAKYVMRIEAVASLAHIGQGKGGYWEDAIDYEWYAGI